MPRYICWLCTPYPMYPRSPLGWLYWYRTQRGHASSSRPNPLGQFVRSGHPLAMWHNSGFERSSGEVRLVYSPNRLPLGGSTYLEDLFWWSFTMQYLFTYHLSLSVFWSSPVNSQYQPQVRPSGFRWNSQGTYHEQRRHPVEAPGCRLQTLPNGCDVKSGISCQKLFRQQMLKSQNLQTCVMCDGCFKF